MKNDDLEYSFYITGEYEGGDLLNIDKELIKFKISLSNFKIDNLAYSNQEKSIFNKLFLTNKYVAIEYNNEKSIIDIWFMTEGALFSSNYMEFPKIHMIDQEYDIYSATLLGCMDKQGALLEYPDLSYVPMHKIVKGTYMVFKIYHKSNSHNLFLDSIAMSKDNSVTIDDNFVKDFKSMVNYKDKHYYDNLW